MENTSKRAFLNYFDSGFSYHTGFERIYDMIPNQKITFDSGYFSKANELVFAEMRKQSMSGTVGYNNSKEAFQKLKRHQIGDFVDQSNNRSCIPLAMIIPINTIESIIGIALHLSAIVLVLSWIPITIAFFALSYYLTHNDYFMDKYVRPIANDLSIALPYFAAKRVTRDARITTDLQEKMIEKLLNNSRAYQLFSDLQNRAKREETLQFLAENSLKKENKKAGGNRTGTGDKKTNSPDEEKSVEAPLSNLSSDEIVQVIQIFDRTYLEGQSIPSPRKILGLDQVKNLDRSTLKKTYHKNVQKYHPDRTTRLESVDNISEVKVLPAHIANAVFALYQAAYKQLDKELEEVS